MSHRDTSRNIASRRFWGRLLEINPVAPAALPSRAHPWHPRRCEPAYREPRAEGARQGRDLPRSVRYYQTGRADFPHPAFRPASLQVHGGGPRPMRLRRSTPSSRRLSRWRTGSCRVLGCCAVARGSCASIRRRGCRRPGMPPSMSHSRRTPSPTVPSRAERETAAANIVSAFKNIWAHSWAAP